MGSLDHGGNEALSDGDDVSSYHSGDSDGEPELDHPHFINTYTELFINDYYPGKEYLTEQDR
jgi:hypothetical protein